MDGHRFDELTRALAGGSSRRRVLQGLAAGMAGALGRRRVGAQQECLEVDRACFEDFECCGGEFNGSSSAFCRKPRGRDRGKCTCREGFEECGGECVDPIDACEYGLYFENCECLGPDGRPPCGFDRCCDELAICVNPGPNGFCAFIVDTLLP